MNHRRIVRVAVALIALAGASCTAILGIDQKYHEVDAGAPCQDGSQCDDMNACTDDLCTDGRCVSVPRPDMTDAPTQVPGDCHKIVCSAGLEEPVIDATDVEQDGNDCTVDTCDAAGTPAHTAVAMGTACKFAGQDGTCDMFGTCKIDCGPGKADCNDMNPCTNDACNFGTAKCDFTPLPDGSPTPGAAQVPGDCRVHLCIGGNDSNATDDTDLPLGGPSADCTTPTCTMGTPSTPPKGAGTGCNTNGGKVCDGAGTCIQCNADSDCAGKTDDCQHPQCSNHVCGTFFAPADTPVSIPLQKPGDCKVVACDGQGNTKVNADNNDLPVDGNPCTNDVCTGGQPSNPAASANTKCGAGNILVCDGMGKCVGCVDNSNCSPPQTCNPAGCGSPSTCACCPKTCVNQGIFCGIATDLCGMSLNCNDNAKDNSETDVDCGGPSCSVKCGKGKTCTQNGDCQSGFCVEGVCCDTACNGTCQSCVAARKVSGSDGTCGNVKVGTDPLNQCLDDGQASCGHDGQCDGSGACRYYSTGAICAPASCATSTTLNKADTCTAAHACIDNGTQSCGNYICSNNACKTTCASSNDCADPATLYCAAPNCLPKKADGQTCSTSGECTSGNCVDGYCCGSACSGTCMACNVAGLQGKCANIPAGMTDNNPPCNGNFACDGSGNCKKALGQVCMLGADCVSGNCVDGYCCNSACTGLCMACNIAGSFGTCKVVPDGTADPSCLANKTCIMGSCQ